MAKTTISAKQKTSSRKSSRPKMLERHEVHSAELKDPRLIRQVLIDALMENDLETFEDVLIAHLRATSKSRLATTTGLGRQTLYDLIDGKREFNPTLSTLGAILRGIAT